MTGRHRPTPISTLAICMIVASLVMAPEPMALAVGSDKPSTDSAPSLQNAEQGGIVSQEASPDTSAEDQDPDAPAKPNDPGNPNEEQEDPEEPQPPAYDPISYDVPLLATVNNGGTLQEADVTAKLIDLGICVGEAANSKEGAIKLPALTFDAPGTYSYKLELTAKDRPGFSLAKSSLTFVVTVKDEDGALRVVSLSCDGSPVSGLKIECQWDEPAGTWSSDSQGWHYTTYNGVRIADAERVIDGRTYRFNAQGAMVTGWFLDGAVWRYYGGQGGAHDGAMRTHSWLWDGAWYWLDDNGAMATGWRTVDGAHYFMDGSGHMLSSGWKWLGSRWHYLTSSGAAFSGWFLDGSWYYLDPADNCAMATGWKVVDGAHYYMDMSGRMLSGGWKWLGNRWYYLSSSGAAATGWLLNGSWYYLDPASAAMRTGWQKIDNAWYYLDGSGAMHAKGWMRLGNAWYYLYSSGAMASGWQWVGGAWYYLGGPDDGAMKTGWFQDGDYWYYCDGSGAMAHNAWVGSWWVNGSGAWDPSLPASGKTGWQNPSNYYQVSSYGVRFPGAGHGYYVTAPTIRADATREQCIRAFLARARNYLGTPYRWNYSDAPGVGVDCIGLVYQCAYATGMDLGEFNPYNHWITGPHGWHSHDANNFWSYGKIQKIAFESRAPGDLIFWPGHVAIYIGNDQVIEAVPGRVRQASIRASGANYLGVGRLYI